MSKVKKCIQCIDTGIFMHNVSLIYNHTYEESIEYFEEINEIEWKVGLMGEELTFNTNKWFVKHAILEDCTGRTINKNMLYIVINELWKPCPENYIKLAHECLHLCQFIMPLYLDRNKEIESEAYLHSHLMRQILNIIR